MAGRSQHRPLGTCISTIRRSEGKEVIGTGEALVLLMKCESASFSGSADLQIGAKAGSTSSKTDRDRFIGVYPFLADRRKRQSGSLRPVPAFRNTELSSPQGEASDLTVRTAAGEDDELRQPVRAHAQTRREQMRRRSQFVRTAPPASTRHVQPSDVAFAWRPYRIFVLSASAHNGCSHRSPTHRAGFHRTEFDLRHRKGNVVHATGTCPQD